MAAPRVFVSSTYYDLRHVRDDIEIFLKELGHMPVLHNKGNVTYTQDVPLEQSCYNELSTCEIVICIIGNKFGTKSSGSDYSITMEELYQAMRMRKKIYIYVLKDVLSENFTYNKNKKTGAFEPFHVDDIRIHEFISGLRETLNSPPMHSFESVSDITFHLKQQLAGLFQHLLVQAATVTESKTFADLQGAASDIKNLIANLSKEKDDFFYKFNGSIYAIFPVVRRILDLLNINKFKVFITDKAGLIEFMSYLGYSHEDDDLIDAKLSFSRIDTNYEYKLILDYEIFDEQYKIKDIRRKVDLERLVIYSCEPRSFINPVDDLPF